MAEAGNPPRSPTLLPPRKSVELEDTGAHELSGSENEDDHFSDAQESRQEISRPASPIPITRVEKVDDTESYGETPGTPAYKLRAKDAVPDELEIVPDGSRSKSNSRSGSDRPASPSTPTIPKTVVEKVDPSSPSHGEIPGTPAHLKRMADAVPDEVRPLGSGTQSPKSEESESAKSTLPSIPTTIITKVDSEPSHGEVPGTEAFEKRKEDAEPDVVEKKKKDGKGTHHRSLPEGRGHRPSPIASTSPIAADGGFGPMEPDESEESDDSSDSVQETVQARTEEGGEVGIENEDEDEDEDGFGDEFDEFEAGEEDEDFGDFDQGVQSPGELQHAESAKPTLVPVDTAFPLLDFADLDSLDEIEEAMKDHLDALFPTTKESLQQTPPPLPTNQNSIFLSDRSLSLWSQLVAPPPLQPPNWVRSRIRRLFLVSLGVPVDLDEILPASKQKKLILPSMHVRSGSQSPPEEGRRPHSKVRMKHENESSTSVDKQSTRSGRKRKGQPAIPALDLQATKLLCATTTAALSNMTIDELQAHVQKLEELTSRASEVLEYWLKRRDSALGDKEAFEGVIENLVKHARRVRK